MVQQISVLGSTGSIGTQTLDVLDTHEESFSLSGISAGSNIELLKKQILKFSPKAASVLSDDLALALKKSLGKKSPDIYWGEEGNNLISTIKEVKRVVIATPGLPGIKPTISAIRAKKDIAIATKEVLVAAGEVVTKEVAKNKVRLLPIDSEHSAIFQCLEGRSIDQVANIYLTCSGGPFRGLKSKDLRKVTLKQALNHPSWKMGSKITIDSATLMNKGFEVIEAHFLFGIPFDKIKVIVHPQSVIHSAVEFVDGSIIAQIGPPDMRLPIQYALFYPQKRQINSFRRFSFSDYPQITFESADLKIFRCLSLAFEAGKRGGTAPAILNAANDIAVAAFLQGRIPFYKIADLNEKALNKFSIKSHPNLDEILSVDKQVREFVSKMI